ncbi:interleukin-9 [Perognathus longimembris pacificus]|uniref:interleukin-9 n=1 Tax=Perognathus longimembris pacificus TaxID=214514 RepID=UPI002018CC1B|nr:interleukin-9 [Perognathus longimembris pacificus]
MLLAVILTSTLLSLCSAQGQACSSWTGILDVNFLLKKLQKDPASGCSCNSHGTSCLCLPIPSDNCTTPCFHEGLSQIINVTQNTGRKLIFYRVKRAVEVLKYNKCPSFSCEQPCNQTMAGNTMTFLRTLLETFQKAKRGMRGKMWR